MLIGRNSSFSGALRQPLAERAPRREQRMGALRVAGYAAVGLLGLLVVLTGALILLGRRPPPARLTDRTTVSQPAPPLAGAPAPPLAGAPAPPPAAEFSPEPTPAPAGVAGAAPESQEPDAQLQAVRTQVQSETAVLAALNDRADQARTELADLQQQQEAVRATLAELQHQQEGAPATLADLQRQQEEARAGLADLQHQQEATRSGLAEARAGLAELQHQQETARTALAAVQRQQEEARAGLADLQRQQDAARSALAGVQRRFQDAQAAPPPAAAAPRPAPAPPQNTASAAPPATPELERTLGRLRQQASGSEAAASEYPRPSEERPQLRSPPPTVLGQIPAGAVDSGVPRGVWGRPRVYLQYRIGSADGEGEATDLARRLLFSDFAYAQARAVPVSTPYPLIRYFHPEDAEAAQHLGDLLRGSGIDFRVQYTAGAANSSTSGAIEVWLP